MTYRDTKREPWPQLIADIGLSEWKLAMLLGVDPTTVKNWMAGGEPKHCYGQELLKLHRQKTQGVSDEEKNGQPTAGCS